MQVLMKIVENKRKSRAGLKQLFNYINRDNAIYKTGGIGVSDDKEIAFKQMILNKKDWNKNNDNKDRFCFQEILSFPSGTDKELIAKITEEYCNEFYKKGFQSWYGIHQNKDNPHTHIIIDNVNFRTGKSLVSLTEKQLEKEPHREKKEEVFVYEKQRDLFEDICRKNGIEIGIEETYRYMHLKKEKEGGKKWLTKNEYNTFKDKNSWRNIIKDKLEEIYKRIDVNEENIDEIAREYGLGISRHNKEKGTITFGLLDSNGEIESKKKIKLDRLMEQEQGSFTDPSENIFIYSNFFRDRTREKENVRQFEELLEAEREKQIEKELVKVMEEKEKSIKEVVNSLIKNKENQYNRELEREKEVEKLLESNHKDYKQDEKNIVELEQDFKNKQAEIPSLETNVKDYTKNKSLIIEEDLPGKEIKVTEKTDIADEKAKEVERLKALLEQAQAEYNIANNEKEQAISELENTKDRIENLDNLIKSTEKKIIDNKEKIISIPREITELKEGLEEKKNVIASNQEELKKVSNNVKIRKQEYREIKDTGMEKVLEYESIMRDLFNKQLEAEEQHKQEVADRYQKEIEEYQNNLKRQNAEWDKINKLNADIREQVRLEREQKALAKKKELQKQRAKEEHERKLQLDLQEFIKLIDKGKIEDKDLIEMFEDLEEYQEIRNSNTVQYLMDIKSVLETVNRDISTEKFYGNTEEVKKCINYNEKLLERISKYMNNTDFEEEKELERFEKAKNKSISEEVIEDDFVIDKKGDFEYGR
ncbi:relaxase/mobilization nuclease domain-containing protein [Fusobacterium polymorphum]|uniref:Relaxase n=1 Tax=Fusobacterium nucleatum subsp. polymorphum TaxID=76857 RepID=A0AAC9F0W3_FUSNP|nr:relaxase/mobilization nuclease domain-containing protein [Fusobacterium polymorphum]ALM95438.1 relaxase [Fusobacterium polymorphum]